MYKHPIIVIGASAGGVETLTRLVKALPSDLTAAILITIHFPSYATSYLPKILNRCRTLPAHHPEDGEQIQVGTIYVAPPDYHLLLHNHRVHLSRAPQENGHRPAIDPMFRSTARTYQQHAIGVILSGMLDDGTSGLAVIKSFGGIALVQDPEEALFDAMPRSAIANVDIDAVLKISDLAARLVTLTNEMSQGHLRTRAIDAENSTMSPTFENESDLVHHSKAKLEQGEHPENSPSMLTCPGCGGVMWEVDNGNLIRFRCHVGHSYSIDSLLSEQANTVEIALWSAVRALEEKAALSRRMAERSRQQNHVISAERFEARATDVARQANIVRQVIAQQNGQNSTNNRFDGNNPMGEDEVMS